MADGTHSSSHHQNHLMLSGDGWRKMQRKDGIAVYFNTEKSRKTDNRNMDKEIEPWMIRGIRRSFGNLAESQNISYQSALHRRKSIQVIWTAKEEGISPSLRRITGKMNRTHWPNRPGERNGMKWWDEKISGEDRSFKKKRFQGRMRRTHWERKGSRSGRGCDGCPCASEWWIGVGAGVSWRGRAAVWVFKPSSLRSDGPGAVVVVTVPVMCPWGPSWVLTVTGMPCTPSVPK
jgi:hypothetical protein